MLPMLLLRRILIPLVVLVALFVVADRVAVHYANRVVAQRIQSDQGLSSKPDVSIGGFPFLTQAIGGRYDDVTVTLHDVRRGPVRVDRLTAHLNGVHVSLGAVFSQHLSSVPVDKATAQVFVAFPDLNAYLATRHISVSADGKLLRVTGSVTVAGHTITASGEGRLSISGDSVVVTASQNLGFQIPLTGLPFRIKLESAIVTNQGITVSASAEGLVLHSRG
jgi:hypothetical protein